MEGVVEDELGLLGGKGAEVPVDVGGEHDGGGVVEGDGHDSGAPGGFPRDRGGADGVCHVGDDITREAFEGLVEEGESDGAFVVGDDGPVTSIVAYIAAVEGVGAVVFVFRDIVLLAVEREGAVFDPVDVSPD